MTTETDRALAKALADIEKQHGPNKVLPGSDPRWELRRSATGILTVDAFMKGGFGRGRHTEIYGTPAVGKTTLCNYAIAAAQLRGEKALFVDAEKTFEPKYAASAGVDLDALHIHKQQSGPQVIDIVEKLVRTRAFGLVVFDSIASLIPKRELETPMEAGRGMGTSQAQFMSEALRRLTNANEYTTYIWINQLRENPAVMFGDPKVTTGGKSMGYYASTRLEFAQAEILKDEHAVRKDHDAKEKEYKKPIGHRVIVRCYKDKTGATQRGRQTTFVIDYETRAIDHVEDLIYLGLQTGIIKAKKGSWTIGRGRSYGTRKAAKEAISISQPLREKLESAIRSRIGLATTDPSIGTGLGQPEAKEEAAEPKRKPSRAAKGKAGPRKTAARKR